MVDFDMIMRMNWLSSCYAIVDPIQNDHDIPMPQGSLFLILRIARRFRRDVCIIKFM